MQFKKLLYFIISVTLLFTGCDSKPEETTKTEDEKSFEKEVKKEIQTKFSLSTTDSQVINLELKDNNLKIEEIQGKAILVNFWATWCPPCKAEIPHLINLKEKYKDQFEIIAVNVGNKSGKMSKEEELSSFLEKYKINYIVTNSEENYNLAQVMDNVSIIPTMFLFDLDGKMIQKYVGVAPEEMIETDIKKILGK